MRKNSKTNECERPTAFDLDATLLRVVRVQHEIHGTAQRQRQPGKKTKMHRR